MVDKDFYFVKVGEYYFTEVPEQEDWDVSLTKSRSRAFTLDYETAVEVCEELKKDGIVGRPVKIKTE